MKEICIPITHFGEDDIAEVQVTVGGKKYNYNFRVESFPWEVKDEDLDDEMTKSLARIALLKKSINSYDDGWELIQIFTPSENATHIQVLYRKKDK